MTSPLESLVACGTKLWLDSVDPDLVRTNRALGATGATSNPIIISDLIKTGPLRRRPREAAARDKADDDEAAWQLDRSSRSRGAGSVSAGLEADERRRRLRQLRARSAARRRELHAVARRTRRIATSSWARSGRPGHQNRMIKVPATPAGLGALEELCAAGVTLNVTLIFSMRQYEAARDAVWRGAQRRKSLDAFKSVYSIFVSRVDVYTEKHVPELVAGRAGPGRHRQREANLASEPEVLGRQEARRCSRRSSSPAPARRSRKIRRGSMSRRSPAATSRRIRRRRTRRCRRAAARFDAGRPDAAGRCAGGDRCESGRAEDGRPTDARGRPKFADPQKALLKLIGDKRKSLAT